MGSVDHHPSLTDIAPAASRPKAMAARPLVVIAVAFIVGLSLHRLLPAIIPLWITATVFLLTGAHLLRARSFASSIILAVATAVCGLTIGQLDQYHYPAAEIAHYTADERRLAQVEMRIADPPRIFAPDFGQSYPLPPRQTTIAEVIAVRTIDGWQGSSGRVLVQIAEPHPELAVGQTVRAFGMIDRPAPAMNPGQFDWAAYYRQQRVLGSFHVPHATNLVILSRDEPTWVQRWRAYTRSKLSSGFTQWQSLDHALLRALVLGDSDPELRDVQDQFRATGTSHHLAISGLHVAVMGGAIFFLARLARLSPRWAWRVAIVFVVVYGLAALPSPPVVRSVLIWVIVGIAILRRWAVDLVNLLSLVVLLMLLYHPLDLFNPGFQLSFGTVLGLLILTAPIAHALGGPVDLTADPADRGRWYLRLAHRIDSQIIIVISAGVAAWLVSMPVIATHFAQLNLWAILSSIVMAPVVFVALIGGVAKIVLSILWPTGDALWALLSQQPIWAMRTLVDALTRLPAGDLPLPAPPWWVIVTFYITLLLATANWQRPGVKLLTRLSHLAALGLLLLLPLFGNAAQAPAGGKLRVTLLSIGAGQCAVIEPPSGRVMLIDAGSLSMADPVRRCIGPFLRERGITSIDTIVISHANSDHFSAVADLVQAYGVREVLTAESFALTGAGNPAVSDLLTALKQANRPPRSLAPGHVVPLGSETAIEVLWPPPNLEVKANDQSLVLRLSHVGRSILFTGDIEDAAMTTLLANPVGLKADVLIAPHHGSSETQTPAFLAAVNPTTIVSSNDRSLTGKQTAFDEMARGIPLYRTHLAGAVTLLVSPSGVETMPHVTQATMP
jgi:competence protein ComEC